MTILDSLQNKPLLSYEVFPPKPTTPIYSLYYALDDIKALRPDFVSVTYGAQGKGNTNATFQIASTIQSYGIQSATHFTCIGLTKQAAREKLDQLKQMGIKNILALRGDIPKNGFVPGDFTYASDLAAFIRDYGGFHIMGACYPEGHIEASNFSEDLDHLKIKVDSGVEHLITQLFLDNSSFYHFLDECHKRDIQVPIEAGIMPVVNKRQILRITKLCGANIPQKFQTILDRYENDPVALRDAGIAYAIDQIVDLLAHGVDGIHLYMMNNPYIAKKIHDAVQNLL